jgi:hypothetical protein
MKRKIVAGYLWQGRWTGPGFPIYPIMWSQKPDEKKNPYYTQADYDRYQEEMKKSPADEVLDIKPGLYTLVVDYPCDEYEVDVDIPENGITRQELMDKAADAYHQVYKFVNEGIYANQEIAEHDKEFNKYNIWGHSMSDLTIHTFYVDDFVKEIRLGVDS